MRPRYWLPNGRPTSPDSGFFGSPGLVGNLLGRCVGGWIGDDLLQTAAGTKGPEAAAQSEAS